jgi:hypothetical protein
VRFQGRIGIYISGIQEINTSLGVGNTIKAGVERKTVTKSIHKLSVMTAISQEKMPRMAEYACTAISPALNGV